jgi:chromosome segregation ATPase
VIPEWFHNLHHQATVELADVGDAVEAQRREDARVDRRITELANQLRQLEPHCAPHDDTIASLGHDVDVARRRHRHAERALADSGLLGRRTARHDLANAIQELTTAETTLAQTVGRAQPLLDQRNELRVERSRLREHATRSRPLIQALDQYDHRPESAEQTVEALGTWKNWADGRDVTTEQLVDAATALHDNGHPQHVALGEPLLDWMKQRGITIEPATPQIEPPGLELGL